MKRVKNEHTKHLQKKCPLVRKNKAYKKSYDKMFYVHRQHYKTNNKAETSESNIKHTINIHGEKKQNIHNKRKTWQITANTNPKDTVVSVFINNATWP